MKELKERWKSETPTFWKKIQKFSLWGIGLCTSVLGINPAISAMGVQFQAVPDLLVSVAAHGFGIFTVVAFLTQFAKSDKLPQ